MSVSISIKERLNKQIRLQMLRLYGLMRKVRNRLLQQVDTLLHKMHLRRTAMLVFLIMRLKSEPLPPRAEFMVLTLTIKLHGVFPSGCG